MLVECSFLCESNLNNSKRYFLTFTCGISLKTLSYRVRQMAPVALPDEGSFALNAFGKQSPSTEPRTERQNDLLLFCAFLIICYSYLIYNVNKKEREAEQRYQVEQRLDTEQGELEADSTNVTKTGIGRVHFHASLAGLTLYF